MSERRRAVLGSMLAPSIQRDCIGERQLGRVFPSQYAWVDGPPGALQERTAMPGPTKRRARRDDGDTALQTDPELTAYIEAIRAIDNHAHVNSTVPGDLESDALPLETLFPFPLPARLREDAPQWVEAARALYAYPHSTLSDPHVAALRSARERVLHEQGDNFPSWVLDCIGTEVMLANRVAMGPGLRPPRFRWVSYVDALMFPFSTRAEAAQSPDRQKLFPLVERLLQRYLSELGVGRVPETLQEYLRQVVTPTLEHQREAGCVAVKFEAAFLRSLQFDDVPYDTASQVYSRAAQNPDGALSHAGYKAVQDYLFRYIGREAGRLRMAVHAHCYEGPGAFYQAAGSDPLLLESVLNDPTLRQTNFVLVHGGGAFSTHAAAMLWKPNVYVDTSAMALILPAAKLASVLRDWLLQFPEKVLFGTDAAGLGPDVGWEMAAWAGTSTVRGALAIALAEMMRNDEVVLDQAKEIARKVMRANAAELYRLTTEDG